MVRWYLYGLILFCCLQAHPQLLPIKTYSVQDGLVSKDITATIRDDKGLLWVGTPFGVNWFDGKNFHTPHLELKTGRLYVTNFYKDSEGAVWVLTFYNGLYRFKNNQFTNFLPAALESNSNSVFDMVKVDKNRYLLATDQNIYWFDGSAFSLFDSSRADLKVQFTSVACLDRENIFFGNEHGLFWSQLADNRWHSKKILEGHAITDLFHDGDDLWISTNKGLLLYKPPFLFPSAPSQIYFPNQNTGNITKDDKGGIWLTVSGNICHVEDDRVTTYTGENGIPTHINGIYCDSESIKWIATRKGLSKLYKASYEYDKLDKAGINGLVTQLEKDKDGNLWIGTYGGLAKKTDAGYTPYTSANGKTIGYVSWLHQSRNGQLFAGTNAGLIEIKNDRLLQKHALQTTVMCEDDAGIFWLGTVDGKVFRYSDEKLEEINPENRLPDFIDGIYRDKNGFLWIGYRGSGIRKYSILGTKLITVKEFPGTTSLRDLRIRCAYPDQKGNIIFGTRTNGIYIFSTTRDDKYWHFNTRNGLSANWIKSVSVDEQHRLYLATNNGITIISGNYDQPRINRVNLDDNNIPAETNFVFYDHGNLWVGMDGVLKYDLADDNDDKTAPAVFLTQVSINGQPDSAFVPYAKPLNALRLQHDQNIVAFEFAGIYFKDEHDLLYRYKLEGQDKDWSQPTPRNNVNYNLRPGHYIFRVQAKTDKGDWSKEYALLTFIIAKPFWQADWFIVLCTLLVASILYALYRYRLQQVLKLERLRSRISTDLHDDIGSTLSSISILSDMTLREHNKDQSADMVQEIKTSSISLMEKMDDIVWSINPKNDSLENLMLRIRRFASTLFEAKDIDYVIEIDDSIKQVKLSMEYRQHIYLVLKEAINNLVKYSGSTRASITVKFENDHLKVTVSDNGRGFDQQKINHGNGIMSMNRRARSMKGDLVISSAKQQGTIVFLKVKIK